MFLDTAICHYSYFVGNTTSYAGGQWYALDTAVHFLPNNFVDNPEIMTYNMGGVFPVFYLDNACQDTVSTSIEFMPYVYAAILDSAICQGANLWLNPYVINTPPLQSGYSPPINGQWWDGNTEVPRLFTDQGNYVYTAYNSCNSVSDTAEIDHKPCDISAPNILVVSSLENNNVFKVNYEGISSFNCIILNRWGNVIYEYTDPAGYWDGKASNGDYVEEGTYFYRIDAILDGGQELQKHGFVVVKY
jgi:hypothetical protein